MDELHQVQLDMNEDEEIDNDKVVNLNDPPVVWVIEEVFADILSLGPKIMDTFTEELHQGLVSLSESKMIQDWETLEDNNIVDISSMEYVMDMPSPPNKESNSSRRKGKRRTIYYGLTV
jgi:hypothetical protein